MERDISNKLSPLNGFAPAAAKTADEDGAAVDRVAEPGFGAIMHVVNVGASGITLSGTDYIALELEESDDNIAWNNCANADMVTYDPADLGTEGDGEFARLDAPAKADSVYKVGYNGNKRYSRLVLNFEGTHGAGTFISGMAVRGKALGEAVD